MAQNKINLNDFKDYSLNDLKDLEDMDETINKVLNTGFKKIVKRKRFHEDLKLSPVRDNERIKEQQI